MEKQEYRLIGYPLGHSISPQIHDKLFKLTGVNGTFSSKEIEPENFDDEIKSLKELNGFNVTIPFKQRIIPLLDSIDARARRYSAVNVVKCKNGGLHGYNTDVEGFLRALKQADISLSDNVLLCGAGGVAHMMACEALDRGCNLTIATQTYSKALACAEELQKVFPSASITPSTISYLSGSFDLILNGTPSGMYPNVRHCPVPSAVARSAKAVFDAIYNPYETQLMSRARSAGAKVQGGLTMLVWQAAASHEIWYGAHFNPDDIEALCEEMTKLITSNF